jgi:hypothetical protein
LLVVVIHHVILSRNAAIEKPMAQSEPGKNKCINMEIITKCKIRDLSTFKKPLRCGERYLSDININGS